ncbi:MAG TPA: isopeptide-forming domain-containing fimbrial protein, partial [Chloroflexi bacterium]|nr:isopeptide-forming domain-containing fimbrial protein [Chloroflexota bacterium]
KPLAAANASVSLGIPSSVMIGEDFSLTVGFENTGTDPGYGPFIDLIFPYTGQDGDDGIEYYSSSYLSSALEDDIQFFPDDGGGSGCVSHPWLRDVTGSYVDVCGYAGDQFVSIKLPFGSYVPGQPRLDINVNAHLSNLADLTPNLLIYARGGYMFGDTPEDDWCCGDTPYAVPNGTDSTTWPDTPVTPQVMTFGKAYAGPGNTNDETSTGPNFPRQYTLTVDIANGQTLNNILVQDQLPDNVQFIGIDAGSTTIGCIATTTPSIADPGGTLEVDCGTKSGTVVVVYDFYIPELYDLPNPPDDDADFDDPVIDPDSGDDVTSSNIAWVDASWTPFDGRDPLTPISSNAACPTCTPLHDLEDKSIAIQKSVAVFSGGVGPGNDPAPGAVLEYTIIFQISDYFTFDDLILIDTISDGQHVLDAAAFIPTLSINGNPSNYSSDFISANFDVVCDYTVDLLDPARDGSECDAFTTPPPVHSGGTTLTFNVSDQLGGNGRMVGGCVNPGGGMFTPCDFNPLGDSGAGPTTATIVFRTVVLDQFVNTFPSGDRSVDQGDVFSDTVDVSGDILDNSTWTLVGSESDDAEAIESIGRESLAKKIYAINDETNSALWERDGLGRVRIKPGDKVTYELEYGLLTSDVEELTFDDFFPLPVFDVTDPDDDGAAGPAWSFSAAGGIPSPGVVTLRLPGDTFYQYMTDGLSGGTGTLSGSTNNNPPTQAPVIVANGPENKINIYFADYDDTRNLSTTVDLLFSLIVSDDPFADGLFLTNMAHAFEGSTNAGTSSSDAIIQFVIAEPVLTSTKGVVWTSNNNPIAVFDPIQIAPAGVNFLDPTNSPRWTGLVNSTGLANNPIDSNLSGVDAGDIVTFAIVVENQGSSLQGAFDIQLRDLIDTGYYLVPTIGADLNLQVYYGDRSGPIGYKSVELSGGTPVCTSSSDPDCGLELFQEGIEFIDPAESNPLLGGICSAHDPNLGNNIILVTYDLVLRSDVIPGQAINTATVFNFAGTEGGPDHLEFVDDLEDDATVDVVGDLEKTLENTEIITAGINEFGEVVIGELVTYKLSAVVPEGNVPAARLVDHLDGGLAFVSCDLVVVTSDGGLTTDLALADFSGVCAETEATGVSNAGQDITFDLGNITNADRDDNLERIDITYQVVVLNQSSNQGGATTLLDNAAEFQMNPGSGYITLATADADDVTVIEPILSVAKSSIPVIGDYGDTISFTIDLSHDGTSETTAYDVVLTDTIPADMTYVGGTLVCTPAGGLAPPDTCTESGGIITVDWLNAANPFAEGHSATITFDVTLDLSVTPGAVITNNADLAWTSLSGDQFSVPRSTYNALAVERTGDVTGPGTTANDYLVSDGADVTIFSPGVDKQITGTNQTFTANNDVTIGEQVSYRSSFIIPEGTSTAAVLVDTLDQGLAFLSCDSVTVIGSLATTGAFDCSSVTFSNVGAGQVNEGRRMTLDLGVVTNTDTNNATDESITVEYTVVVINGGSNDRGDSRNNAASWNWSGGSRSDSADNVTIVEPGFVVTKTASPITGDYADLIDFTINLTPSGASNVNAYEVVLTDIIPADMTYVTASLVCTPLGGLAVPDICNESGGTITVEWLGAGKPFETGHSATIAFQATLDLAVSPGEVITNSANLVWTSLPGGISSAQSIYNPLSVERTGDITDVGGVDNDYRASGNADVTIFRPTGSKDVINTNQAFTILNNVAIGEQITYQADFIIPEGTSTTAHLVDTLDAGLAFVSCDSVTVIGSLTTTTAFDCSSATFSDYPDSTAPNQGRQMDIDLGVVVNNDTDNTTDESISVVYTVVVINGGSNDRGDTRTNSASWTWDSDSTTESAPNLTIQEPTLEITKTASVASGDAGDLITFDLLLQHAAGSDIDAYEVELTDLIPAKMTYVSASLSCTPAGGLASPTTCLESGGTITVAWSGAGQPFETGHSATIQFKVTLDDTVNPTEVITNTADMEWTSLPTDIDTAQSTLNSLSVERTGDTADIGGAVNDYAASDSDTVTVPDVMVAKTISPSEFTIGETFTYDLVITLPEGVTPDMVVYDDIPVGLEFVSYNLITTTAEAGSLLTAIYDGTFTNASPTATVLPSGDLELNFGDTITNEEYPDSVPTNNRFQVQVEVRMLNIIGNQSGVSLTNRGELRYSSGTTATGTVDVTVIEPVLSLNKTSTVITPISGTATLGATIEYTLALSNPSASSSATAYDMVLTDSIPTGMTYVLGSITAPAGWVANDSAAPLLTWTSISGTGLALDATASFTYRVTIDSPGMPNEPSPGQLLQNAVNLTWTSLDGPSSEERDGTDGPGGVLNDYASSTQDDIYVENIDLRIEKDDRGAIFNAGDTLVYDLSYFNDGSIDATGVVITETVPVDTTFDLGGSSGVWSCADNSPAGTTCTQSLGTVAPSLGVPTVVQFAVTIDNPLPAAVTTITNNVSIADDGSNGPEPTPGNNSDSIITPSIGANPDLTITKDDGIEIGAPGTRMVYNLVYENVGTQDATGVVITETVSTGVTFDLGNSTPGWVVQGTGVPGVDGEIAGTVLEFDVGNVNVGDAPVTVNFAVIVDNPLAPGITEITNTASIADDGNNGPDLTPGNNTDDDVDGIAFHEKDLVAQLHGVTTLPDVAIGEILTYEVILTVPPGSMTHTHLVDTIDLGLAFVSCESISAGSLTTSIAAGFASICANPVVNDLPGISPDNDGRQVDFDFDAITNPNAPGGATIDLVIRYQVVVLDSLGNQSGSTPLLVNDAEWVWDSGVLTDQADGVNILEPDMTISKDAFPTRLYPGQLTTFTLTVEHTPGSQTSAFDVEIEDIIPSDLIFQSAVNVSGQAPTAIIIAGDPTILIQWDEFLNDGTNSVIDIVVQLDPTFRRTKQNQFITNDASLSWTSLPGDFSTAQSIHNSLSTERFYDPLSNINIYGVGD